MKVRIREAVLVEGKYDAARLRECVDAPIFECRGFRIFKDKEQTALLRYVAEKRGIIVLTDSDSAGFVIRGHISGIIQPRYVKHAYIPQLEGKEARKTQPSKEGLLGVEGMDAAVVIEALRRSGATFIDEIDTPCAEKSDKLTVVDLYETGLTGTDGSAEKRSRLLKELGFPAKMTAGRLLDVLNAALTKKQFFELLQDI